MARAALGPPSSDPAHPTDMDGKEAALGSGDSATPLQKLFWPLLQA